MGWLNKRKPATPEDIDLTDDASIDLRPHERMVGEPGDCPECHHPAYLERLDIECEVQFEHCRACGLRWATPFSELTLRP